jgi:hypothetical protein
MTTLDNLEKLARAASHAHYVAAISPDMILRLIAVVRAADLHPFIKEDVLYRKARAKLESP